MKLAYLGPEASFSHICAQKILYHLPQITSIESYFDIHSCAKALDNKQVQYSLLPVENSLGGSVSQSLDEIMDLSGEIKVQLEYILPIKHNLLGFFDGSYIPGYTVEVRAHQQSFAQCKKYLQKRYPFVTLNPFSSNSAAIKSIQDEDISQVKKIHIAAIGSEEAAIHYNVPIIDRNIQDSNNNRTRFWLLGRDYIELALSEDSKSLFSFTFQIPSDKAGSLVEILQPLAQANINLTRIESRPTRGRLGEYTFFVDAINSREFDFSLIEKKCSYFRSLGNYKVVFD